MKVIISQHTDIIIFVKISFLRLSCHELSLYYLRILFEYLGANLTLTDHNGKTALDKANELMDENSSTSITSYSKERLIACRNLIQSLEKHVENS